MEIIKSFAIIYYTTYLYKYVCEVIVSKETFEEKNK